MDQNINVTVSEDQPINVHISAEGAAGPIGPTGPSEDFYTNAAPVLETVGGIAAGTTFEEQTMGEMWDALLYPELFPTLVNPSNTLTLMQEGIREVGEIIASLNFSAGFSRGSISPAYGTSGYRSGLPVSYNYSGAGLPSTAPSPLLSNSQIVSNYTVLIGTQSWTGTVSYSMGEQPKSSKDSNYSTPLSAGTTGSITRAIIGVYPYFATTVNIGTYTKQALALMNSTYIEITMVAETEVNKQTVDFPIVWSTITGIQFYNTISGMWEWIHGGKAASLSTFTTSLVLHTVQGNSISYTRFAHNGSTIGSRKLRFYTN